MPSHVISLIPSFILSRIEGLRTGRPSCAEATDGQVHFAPTAVADE